MELLNSGPSHKSVFRDKDWVINCVPLIPVNGVLIGENDMKIIIETILDYSKSMHIHSDREMSLSDQSLSWGHSHLEQALVFDQ